MAGRSLIRLEDVWKVYDMGEVKVEALRGLSFEVKQGEFVSVRSAKQADSPNFSSLYRQDAYKSH